MEDFLTHKEAAELLRISERTLTTLNDSENPPPYAFVGGQRRYYKDSLIEWAKSPKINK